MPVTSWNWSGSPGLIQVDASMDGTFVCAIRDMESTDMIAISHRAVLKSLFSAISLSSTLTKTVGDSPLPRADDKPVEWRVSLASLTHEGFAPGYKSANQDAAIAISSFGDGMLKPGSFLMGVFDGHGRAGHDVSRFMSQKLPTTLLSMLRDPNHADHPFLDTFEDLNARMGTAIEDAAPNNSCKAPSGMGSHRDGLKKCGGICGVCKPRCGFDAYNSGSTAVVSHIDPNTCSLVTAWTGDSRAVLGVMAETSKGSGGSNSSKVSWQAVDLSNDHKPDRPDERRRIVLTGGRVAPSRTKTGEYDGPARVWLPNHDYPGLAMSRAMGDLAARPAGIICAPDTSRVNLNLIFSREGQGNRGGGQKVRDKAVSLFSGLVGSKTPLAGMEGTIRPGRCFVVLASDGVFEFMSSSEVVDLVARRLVWTRFEEPGLSYERGKSKEADIWEESKDLKPSSSPFMTSWESFFGRSKRDQGLKPSMPTGVTPAQADAACEEACREVVRESLCRWKKEYGGRYIDDITVCIAQLETVD